MSEFCDLHGAAVVYDDICEFCVDDYRVLIREVESLRKLVSEKTKKAAKQVGRIKALEGVVGVAKKWCDLEAAWQVHSGNCEKCLGGEMCSEEWEDKLFAVGNAWMNMFGILSKLEEV